jgi:hypothetical protein
MHADHYTTDGDAVDTIYRTWDVHTGELKRGILYTTYDGNICMYIKWIYRE